MNAAERQALVLDNSIMRAMTQECPDCKGRGYTRDTETVMMPGREFRPPLPAKLVTLRDGVKLTVSLRTWKQGSGCGRCHGTGRLPR